LYASVVTCAELDVQIVISRFNEDLEWLDNAPFNTSRHLIYNKGPVEVSCSTSHECSISKLPNVGREGHTYLHHIITNYDNLANLTVFLPGSAYQMKPYPKWSKTMKVMNHLIERPGTVIPIPRFNAGVLAKWRNHMVNQYQSTDARNSQLNPERAVMQCPERPFGKWYLKNFPDLPLIQEIDGYGIFAVSKEHIRQHPISHYEKLIAYVNTSSNPEAGHYLEYSWGQCFTPTQSLVSVSTPATIS